MGRATSSRTSSSRRTRILLLAVVGTAVVTAAVVVTILLLGGNDGSSTPTGFTRISLTPQRGAPGEQITVSGQGFAPNEQVFLAFEKTSEGSAFADSSGAFEAQIRVPDLPDQGYLVRATGAASKKSVAASFTLRAKG